MKVSWIPVACSLVEIVLGLHLPVSVQKRAPSSLGIPVKYGSASISKSTTSQPELEDVQNIMYTTVVTVGGQDYTVQIDTGSSDLWVFSQDTLPEMTLSRAYADISYLDGSSASGPVAFAEFSIGSYSVESQAFINTTNPIDMDDTFDRGVFGLIGISFSTDDTSRVEASIEKEYNNITMGQSPLANIFSQNTSLPNFITVSLGRSGDLEDVSDGAFTISEVIDGYENILETTKLERIQVPGAFTSWAVVLDSMTVNGKQVPLKSVVKGLDSGKAVAVLDTGTSLAGVPKYVMDAMYSGMPNALYDSALESWVVPCNATADVRFVFGGQEIPLHPLDLMLLNTGTNDDGSTNTFCTSTFGTLGSDDTQDMLLGDAFLRNVYSLFDYGDFTGEEGDQVANAYIQVLALTDPKDALADFNRSRSAALVQSPPEATFEMLQQMVQADNNSASTSSKSSSTSNGKAVENAVKSGDSTSAVDKFNAYGPAIIGLLSGNLLVGIILCAIGMSVCIRRGASVGSASRSAPIYAPVRFKEDNGSSLSERSHPGEAYRDEARYGY